MSDSHVLAQSGPFTVTAHRDFSQPPAPQHMGYPTAILSLDDKAFTQSWPSTVNESAILKAFAKFGDSDIFRRWLIIFADDLVIGKGELEITETLSVDITKHYGYSQGDVWLAFEWSPAGITVTDGPTPELIYWARGDVYYLELTKDIVFSAAGEDDIISRKTLARTHGYYTDDPENNPYLSDAAKDMLP